MLSTLSGTMRAAASVARVTAAATTRSCRLVQVTRRQRCAQLLRSSPPSQLLHTSPTSYQPAAAASTSASSSSSSSPTSILGPHDVFLPRHLGPSHSKDVAKMLDTIGFPSLDALIEATVPAAIRSKRPLSLPPQGETEALCDFVDMMKANELFRSYIGLGYYDTLTPPVILRNIIENPAWYTPYTPYQAEIAQGRLEMLLNYQTMVSDLTGLPVSNSSLLDEGTAAAEAMSMCYNAGSKKRRTFLVSQDVHPQTIAVVKTRAKGVDIDVRVQKESDFDVASGSRHSRIQRIQPALPSTAASLRCDDSNVSFG